MDAEINLVPFIDLLSMCICFLLMTAVWMQIGTLPVKQARGTDAAPADSAKMEADVRFTGPHSVRVSLKKKGASVRSVTYEGKDAAELAARMDQGLGGMLKALGNPEIGSAMVTPRSGVEYGDLVSVMDQLRKHQIVNLGVVPVGER